MYYRLLFFLRLFVYALSIVILIISCLIKNENILKNNVKISIFMIIYLLLDVFWFEYLFKDPLEVVLILFFSIIAMIIYLISIIINNKKLLNETSRRNINFFTKHYNKLFIFLIILTAMSGFLYEIFIVNNADVILMYEKHTFISEGVVYIAVNKKYGKTFSIDKRLIKSNIEKGDFIKYFFESDGLGKKIHLDDSEEDPKFEKINMNIVEKIYEDIIFREYFGATEKFYNNKKIHYYFIKIEGTNYYLVECYNYDFSFKNRSLYHNDKFIEEIDSYGGLEEVYILKK